MRHSDTHDMKWQTVSPWRRSRPGGYASPPPPSASKRRPDLATSRKNAGRGERKSGGERKLLLPILQGFSGRECSSTRAQAYESEMFPRDRPRGSLPAWARSFSFATFCFCMKAGGGIRPLLCSSPNSAKGMYATSRYPTLRNSVPMYLETISTFTRLVCPNVKGSETGYRRSLTCLFS